MHVSALYTAGAVDVFTLLVHVELTKSDIFKADVLGFYFNDVTRRCVQVQSMGGGCEFKEEDCGCVSGEAGCQMPDVKDVCMGRSSCRLDVTQQYIGTGACHGFSDYMYIEFTCLPGMSAEVTCLPGMHAELKRMPGISSEIKCTLVNVGKFCVHDCPQPCQMFSGISPTFCHYLL